MPNSASLMAKGRRLGDQYLSQSVTPEWLAQAEAAVPHGKQDNILGTLRNEGSETLSVIEEFNKWRKNTELAEAVAAIRALTAVIRHSQAHTMMELEHELTSASHSLKVC